jgi:tetratricopeptide (TPR) repeat protein
MTSFRRHLIAIVLLAAIGFLAYGRSLRNGFVWDDDFQIQRNPFVHAGQPWSPLFTSDVWSYTSGTQRSMSNYYRPMQMLTYRLIAEGPGVEPAAYHLASILLNIFATVAAYWLLWLLTRRWGLALAAAVLFAAHPMHSEAVLWISALTEIGCALFYFAAFALFICAYRNSPEAADQRKKSRKQADTLALRTTRRKPWLLAASALCGFIAILWKEMALTLPAAIAAYVFFTDRESSIPLRVKHALLRSLPHWAGVALYVPLRIAALGYFTSTQHVWNLTPTSFALSALELVGKYWLKLALPTQLNAFHVFYPGATLMEARALLSLIFVVVAAVLLFLGWRRAPLPSFAAAWVFVTLAPVLNIQGVGQNVFAERYLYIPSLGFCLLVAYAGAALLRRVPLPVAMRIAVVTVAILSVAGTVLAARRASAWSSDFSLFSQTAQQADDSSLIHNSLGEVLKQRGDPAGAEREYRRAYAAAAAATPADRLQMANAEVGLASTAMIHDRDAVASLAHSDRALALQPQMHEARVSRGVALLQLGRLEEARQQLEPAYRESPYDEVCANALGVIALARRDYPAAERYFQDSVKVYADFGDGWNNLGRTYQEMGRYQQALVPFSRAVELAPANAVFHHNYGLALGQTGHLAEARAEFERALVLQPNFASAQQALQMVRRAELQAAPQAR